MKNTLFVRISHLNATVILICIYLIFVVTSILFVYRIDRSIKVLAIVGMFVLILTGFTVYLIKVFNSIGLYLKDDILYYKTICGIKQVTPFDVIGIKIIKSQYMTGKFGWIFDLKDSKGNNLYSAVFLKQIKEEMKIYDRGDISFNFEFKDYIMFSVVYNDELINEIIRINPRILII